MTLAELKDDIIIFDIDGTLTKYDFKDYKLAHSREEWVIGNIKDNVYKNAKKTSLFDSLIKSKNASDMYVLSVAFSSFEQNNKLCMLDELYPYFKEDNIIFVADDSYKVYILKYLREVYDNEGKHNKRIVLIEDNVGIMASVESLQDDRIRCYLISDFV